MPQGGLFSDYFLTQGVDDLPEWQAFAEERVDDLANALGRAVAAVSAISNPGETVTERALIEPVLRTLGWPRWLTQQNLAPAGRTDVPDFLLFSDDPGYAAASAEAAQNRRYRHGATILEGKAWGVSLDRGGGTLGAGVPSNQMLRYLNLVEVQSENRIRFGILTNGKQWRLYDQKARSRSEDYFEIDLEIAAGSNLLADDATRRRWIKLFALFFGQPAFVLGADGRTTVERALVESRQYEERVTERLGDVVFGTVFPDLADALAAADPERSDTPAYREELHEATLTYLYRLLFVLYAEDRHLLPVNNERYDDYGLQPIRRAVADRIDAGDAFSPRRSDLDGQLRGLWTQIDEGDSVIGLPPYNGGLFRRDGAPLLNRTRIPDDRFATLLDHLSRTDLPLARKWISYRDLSVQHLGSIYERLLDHELIFEDGRVTKRPNAVARKTSGSYYTPEELVMLVIRRTVGPLLYEKRARFESRADELQSERRAKAERLRELGSADPATAFLELKICDPAMGSGHFLVSLVDYLADEVLQAMADAKGAVDWGDYTSPLEPRLTQIRDHIRREADRHGWEVSDDHLSPRQLVRRMILKRVIFGVDKNPMAVELAKLSLWLHTFTVGAPLSFLNHHLRCGDSLFGEWVGPVLTEVGALLISNEVRMAERAAGAMADIEAMADADIREAHRSADSFETVEEATAPLAAFLSLLHARRWERLNRNDATAFAGYLDGQFGDAIEGAKEGLQSDATLAGEGATARVLVDRLRERASKERFFHWQVGFPGVWRNWSSHERSGGFDAVIGNPPYVRQELITDRKPILKTRYRAFDGMADLYVYFYEQALRLLRPGARLGFVVTNKWMKAGYAEALRGLFADPEAADVEFVADFGHARQFFPGVDVFPSVLVVRRPNPVQERLALGDEPYAEVCVIQREALPQSGIEAAVRAASYRLPRSQLRQEGWTLEPPSVMALLDKVKRGGMPLAAYTGVKPMYGIKTGFNQAYLIDSTARNRLVDQEPKAAAFIRPYLRGQDIERWSAPPNDLFMIVMKSSGDHPWPWANVATEDEAEEAFSGAFPVLHEHFKKYESFIDQKTGKQRGLRHREDVGRWWWELRACAYYDAFDLPKTLYTDITWTASFCLDRDGRYTNNTGYFLPTDDATVLATLNSPIGWWYAWRRAQHGKDEALRYFNTFMEAYPIPPFDEARASEVVSAVERVVALTGELRTAVKALTLWLRHEFGVEKGGAQLASPEVLDVDGFIAAVRTALPRRRGLTAAATMRLAAEHTATIEPLRRAAAEVASLERRLSELVNAAYGLTPEDVRLMWETAPPRMPIST